MIGLDTNVLVRFFMQDDSLQSPKASEIMRTLTAENPGWIGVTTLVELIWVLSSKNRFDRKTICGTISQLLLQEEIEVEHADLVQNALRLFQKGSADFSDCLSALSAQAAGCSRTVTFDRRAARETGMELLA
jgi:predicted nucleic-acid-binding protein